ncbi:MAG: dephospho-CoA kinase [Streptococcaceae bacterium]|jgi:dephospho-CoA kinase|nr:dephospho-CoA kinase [Streptococcaceae bacterium]
MKKVIGLTGGIATGKSAVTSFLRSQGFVVIDADEVVHELQQVGGQLYELILEEYGSEYFDKNGQLNRKKLANLIFSNPEINQKLGKLQNKIIRDELWRRREHVASQQDVFFMDIPLLIEENYEDFFDEIWLVKTTNTLQTERLMKRNSLTKNEAMARINSQMPIEEKVKYANVVLENSGTLEELQAQILQQIEKLK